MALVGICCAKGLNASLEAAEGFRSVRCSCAHHPTARCVWEEEDMELLAQGRAVAKQSMNSLFTVVFVPRSLVFGPENRHTGFIHNTEYTFSLSPGSLFAKESAHSSALPQSQQILRLNWHQRGSSHGSLCAQMSGGLTGSPGLCYWSLEHCWSL